MTIQVEGEYFALHGEETDDPTTYQEAVESERAEQWNKAMEEEIQALIENHTWTETTIPPGKTPIGCKWVFKTKRDAEGNLERLKARVVAKGYNQRIGIDYGETFAPVARFTSIRAILALAAAEDMDIHHMDSTAFLNGDLKEDVYMLPPPGLKLQADRCLKLQKTLYGLKQSSREWNLKLHSELLTLGYLRCDADASVYTNKQDGSWIVVWVDDLLIITKKNTDIKSIKSNLSKKFAMSDLGEVKSFLGLHVTRDRSRRTLSLSQAT